MAGVKGRSGGHNRLPVEELHRRGTFNVTRHRSRKVLPGPGGGAAPDIPPTDPDPVVMPSGLSTAAAGVWAELAPVCLKLGTLTPSDLRPFATLCELQATLAHASRQKDAEGFGMFTLSEDYNGAAKVGVHAAIKVERETAAAIRPYYAMFGLSPADRARIPLGGADPVPVNPLVKFLTR